jgi:hypothetical protein
MELTNVNSEFWRLRVTLTNYKFMLEFSYHVVFSFYRGRKQNILYVLLYVMSYSAVRNVLDDTSKSKIQYSRHLRKCNILSYYCASFLNTEKNMLH